MQLDIRVGVQERIGVVGNRVVLWSLKKVDRMPGHVQGQLEAAGGIVYIIDLN